tara:strand:+ start:655 stop:1536 length:882 start_codon:yes stop_codon:yes gene_type:complete
MKVALCLSGQPRLVPGCFESIYKNIIEPTGCDVYGHIWWDNSYMGQPYMWHSKSKYANIDLGKAFRELYNPKSCVIEPQKEFDLSFCKKHNLETWENVSDKHLEIFTPGELFGITSQAYSVMQSNNLINENYDVVIRARTDLVIDRKITDILEKIDFSDDKIYFQSSMSGGPKYCGEHENNPCDWFCLGSQAAMKKVTNSWYTSIPEFFASGIIHVNEFISLICKKEKIDLYIGNFYSTVKRLPDGKPFEFLEIENYYNNFDFETKSPIDKNKNIWPHWSKNIKFNFLEDTDE